MPNYVTNRLEINADRETVQNVMDFLKGETDEDSTPCYIDFNNIIPMPKDLLIEASTSGEFGMKYLKAMQRKPFNSPDDLKVIQWMEGLTEGLKGGNDEPGENKRAWPLKRKLKEAFSSAWGSLRPIMGYLLIGVALGAGIYGYMPQDFVLKIAGPDNVFAIPVAAVLGIPLYIRAETADRDRRFR